LRESSELTGKRRVKASGAAPGSKASEVDATRLHAAILHILRRLRQVDSRTGVSAPRLSLLSVLVFGGEKTISELSIIEQISMAATSKLISALELEGFVSRRRDKYDDRVWRISATAKGRHVLEQGRDRRVKQLAKELAALSAKERAVLGKATLVFETMLGLEKKDT